MDVVRIRKKIDSRDIHIDELEKFIGREAEIIIFPIASDKKTNKKNLLKLVGSIKTGENPLKFQKKMRQKGV